MNKVGCTLILMTLKNVLRKTKFNVNKEMKKDSKICVLELSGKVLRKSSKASRLMRKILANFLFQIVELHCA